MGFFQKLKQNFKHGSVKLQLQSPDTIRLNDDGADLQLTVLNTSKDIVQLHSITVVLLSREEVSGTSTPKEEEVLQLTIPYEDQIPAHLQSVVPIRFPIHPIVGPETPNTQIAEVASTVLSVLHVSGQLAEGEKMKRYYFIARVNVDGVSPGPSVTNQVNVLNPTEAGGSTVAFGG